MKKADITINITAHKEGLLLRKTLRSVLACFEYAKLNKIENIEINLSLDRPDAETIRVAKQFVAANPSFRLNEVSFGDLADHRNYLISISRSKYIAFFDGDDLFSENYLYEAFKLAENNSNPAVYSPTFLISFDEQNYVTRKLDFNSEAFHVINMYEHNYFISQIFAHSSVYENNLYRPNRDGYGMEDWDWNNRSIYKGIKFHNIPNTLFFYRRKKQSMLSNQVANRAALRPSPLYEPRNFVRYPGYIYKDEIPANVGVDNKTKNNLKKLAKIATLGTDVGYNYLQQQYSINKNFIKRTGYLVKKKLTVQLPDNTNQLIQTHQDQGNITQQLADIGINETTVALWKKINAIEPIIRPSTEILSSFGIVDYPKYSLASLLYYKFCKEFGESEFEDVVLVPHIIRGGADLAAIKLVKSLSKQVDKNILVFSTLDAASPWGHEIRKLKNVRFIELKNYCNGLTHEARIIFILRIIQNWGVKRLNIINSELGYDLLAQYGKVVREHVKTFLHTYAFDMDDEGHIWNCIKNGLVNTYENVDLYITDSEGYRQQLIDVNGFDRSKVAALYLPVQTKLRSYKKPAIVTNKVLWASRLSSAKLVETAVEIGKALAQNNIELHFYGALDAEYAKDDYFANLVKPYPNINYHGKYDGFENIDIENYDLFLLTSKNEGMPNVVLEAAASNMFVVAPSVGGIPEVIEDGINGYLVVDNLHPQEYIQKILDYYKNPIDESAQATANKKIAKQHSQDTYDNNIKKIFSL